MTEPKKIEALMEEKALEDWYADASDKRKRKKVDDATFSFLSNEKRRVRKFISKLSELEQIVVYLRYWENLMACEIAKVVGLSEKKILSLLEASVKKLREFYILELGQVGASTCA